MNIGAARAAMLARGAPPPSNSNGATPLRSVPLSSDDGPPAPAETAQVPVTIGRWAKYAGKLGAGLTVTAAAAAIRAGGHEPNQPDDDDCDYLAAALEEGLRARFGDTVAPWWFGFVAAAGSVYAGMRIGARPRVVELVPDGKPSPRNPPHENPPHRNPPHENPPPKPSPAPAFSVPMPPPVNPVNGNGHGA